MAHFQVRTSGHVATSSWTRVRSDLCATRDEHLDEKNIVAIVYAVLKDSLVIVHFDASTLQCVYSSTL
jgi:hypothetical protein